MDRLHVFPFDSLWRTYLLTNPKFLIDVDGVEQPPLYSLMDTLEQSSCDISIVALLFLNAAFTIGQFEKHRQFKTCININNHPAKKREVNIF